MSITTLSKNWILLISILTFLGLGAGTISAQTSPTLPVDFEDGAIDYNPQGFGDVVAAVIANPDMGAGNMSDTVLTLNKPMNSQTWAGASIDLASAIDLTGGTTFTLKVWSPRAGIPVRFKVEDVNDAAIFSEVDANTTVASAWETLTFDISSAATYNAAHMYSRIALFPDFGTAGMGEDFYMDDIEQVAGQATPASLPMTFDEANVDYALAGFGDVVAAVIANPDMSAGNMSDSVINLNKLETAQTWGGASVDLGSAIDLTVGTVFTVKVWSPRAGVPVRFKVEDKNDATLFSEVDVNTTVASSWETLSFDISAAPTYSAAHMYSRIALFPDFGTAGQTGGENFYMDDIEQAVNTVNLPTLPITFEDTTVDYNPAGFGEVAAMVIANPDMNGNASANVLNLNKPETAQTWGGASIDIAAPLDLTMGTMFSVKVWSPRAGVPIRLKVEDVNDATIFSELDMNTTGASAWETLTFDISTAVTYDAAHNYNRVVLFPDFGTAGQTGGEDYYFDDFEQVETVDPDPVKLPIDFESATAGYAPAGFGDATTEVLDNPDMTGNTSAKVLRITKPAGAQTWAGVSIALDEVIDLSPGAVFSVDVWSPAAGTPILLKFEDTTSPPDGNGNPSIFSELQVSTTAAMSWETLSFDMSTAPTYDAAHNYNQVVLFPNFNTAGADDTYYMDNILNVNAVSIDPDLFANTAFKLYPNPAKQDLNIAFNLPLSGDLSFELMDMMGRVVKKVNMGLRVQGDHTERLQLSEIQSGAYLLLMKIDGDYVKQEKLIIQK
ncbi:MAG: T9SS type A sorting domain-containing protein [Bacteroidia bacterium]|nr:T9SS type A sorting domain-containing protein [Bacteroidia bacterium]